MASEPPPSNVDWRPYKATAIVLGLALALNLWTRNGLWLAYSILGTSLFLFAAGMVRAGRWRFSTRAVWLIGLTWGLHYVGGSLSGLHQIGGGNGLYYAFPWWDNVVHALGCAAVAVAASEALLPILPARRGLVGFLAVAIASLVGVGVELYEFTQYVWFHTVDQGYYTNTMVDLYDNVIGAVLGAVLYLRGPGAPTTAPPPSVHEPRIP